ncbi:MAG TPA: LacI family transcriptional regulator [Candidatus Anaerobutyricum faecale]|nr:LacI family transcriptional regulator [Candidatus Anaerobutyricum faecale]
MSLKEIARRAGTSVSTVSRVLNSENYKCSDPELEKRIWQAAQELCYIPNSAARALQKGENGNKTAEEKACLFDIFLTRFPSLDQDLFFQELYDALKKELLKQRCLLGRLLTVPDITTMMQASTPFSEDGPRADGLILLGKCPSELISPLKNYYHHLVGIDRNPTDFDYDEVVCSGTDAAVTAMDYLISLGHKKIAYIGDCSYEARYIGYYQSLINHNLPLDYSNIYPTSQTRQEGMQMMQVILQKKELPSAIFCANDSTALGVFDCLKTHRRKGYIPSVISIDNIQGSQETKPMLTTIDIPKKEMAHHAVLLLLDQVRGGHKDAVRMELPCRLIVRESCSWCAG